jgi:putative transposase
MAAHQLGVTRACGLIGISRSLYRYEAKRPDDGELRQRLSELAQQKRRYGYRRLHVLLCREGWEINRKRTYRIYHEAGLMVRKRKRIAGVERQVKAPAFGPNQSWSMDFVSDGLVDGRRLRCLNIVEDFTKECLTIEVDTSLPGRRVVSVLERLAELRGLPLSVTVDNGPEFAGKALDEWAYGRGMH